MGEIRVMQPKMPGVSLSIVALCLLMAFPARANIPFFTMVIQNCKHYRISANMIQMSLDDSEEDELRFHLTLPSRRNNFEQVILVGYFSVSNAIARTGLKVKTIYVSADLSGAGAGMMATKADSALADKLRSGQIKPHEFMRQIEWIK